jgi:hypothetical protein
MIVRVVLARHAGEGLVDPPGRDLLASASHTFAQLAAAIDRAFARWDLGHLHEFQLANGTRIASADEDEGLDDGDLDEARERLARLKARSTFEYVFDLGEGWSHDCAVLRDDVDPQNELGLVPTEIVPVFGWGSIPDQYGRVKPDPDT